MRTAGIRGAACTVAISMMLTVSMLYGSAGDATSRAAPGEMALSHARGNPNPGAFPRHARPFGMSYEEWMMAYRIWQSGIPAATNPALDTTGVFCGEEQSGHVWFLTSLLAPGSVVRECDVPAGKALYVPLIGFVTGAPDNLGPTSFIVQTFLGLDPSTLTDEEIIRLAVNWLMDHVDLLELRVDGVAYGDLFSYRAQTPAFDLLDSDLYDDLGIPISHPNVAVADGYAVILAPLPPGPHTIEIRARGNDPLLGPAVFEVTYHLTVGPM